MRRRHSKSLRAEVHAAADALLDAIADGRVMAPFDVDMYDYLEGPVRNYAKAHHEETRARDIAAARKVFRAAEGKEKEKS